MKIIAIYDNGGRSLDQYKLITSRKHGENIYEWLGLSKQPTFYSQWGQVHATPENYNHENEEWRTRTTFGKRIRFEDLAAEVQRHAVKRIFNLMEDEE